MENQNQTREKEVVDINKECFVAMSPYYWGRGKDIDEAKRNLSEAGGTKRGCTIVHIVGDDRSYVDDMGSVRFLMGAKATLVVKGKYGKNPEDK